MSDFEEKYYASDLGNRTGETTMGGALGKDDDGPPPPKPAGLPGSLTCSRCNESTYMLHHPGPASKRSICGICQGKDNRILLNRIAEAVRTLKSVDDPHAIAVLRANFADWRETVDFLAKSRNGKSGKKDGFY